MRLEKQLFLGNPVSLPFVSFQLILSFSIEMPIINSHFFYQRGQYMWIMITPSYIPKNTKDVDLRMPVFLPGSAASAVSIHLNRESD